MIKNEFIKAEQATSSYCEVYDMEALMELSRMAKRYTLNESEDIREYVYAAGQSVPDGTYSDFTCTVWALMTDLIRYGMKLNEFERELQLSETMGFDGNVVDEIYNFKTGEFEIGRDIRLSKNYGKRE